MKKVLPAFLTFWALAANAQTAQDSLATASASPCTATEYKFQYKQLIVPSSMLLIGCIGVKNGWLHKVNHDIRKTFRHHSTTESLDNYLQYLPLAADYGLSALGATAKHNYSDRTITLATSYLSLALLVNGLKFTVDAPRPYGSAKNSFPSGHTATTFMGAEIIRQEYKDDSPLYGIAAYIFAAGIGYARIYNDRHWTTDVIAGAGVGILSARIGYWLLPYTRRLFGKRSKKNIVLAAPFYGNRQGGVTLTALLP